MAPPDNKKIIRRDAEAREFQAMVHHAEDAVQVFAENYEPKLAADLAELKQFLESARWVDARALAYKIKSAAGTMGWPLISTASNFLVHALAGRDHIPEFEDVVQIQFETLDLLHKEGMRGEDPCGILLVKELFSVLENYGVRGPL